jgi:deoxyribodipyrimidine photo-lyase
VSDLQDVEVWMGDTRAVLNERGVGQVITQDTPNRQLKVLLEPFNPIWQQEVKFTNADTSDRRMKRFSRYWDAVKIEMFGNEAGS